MAYYLSDASATTHEFLEKPWVRGPKEVGCALATSLFVVSPLVSIMDKAMIQEISGGKEFMQAFGPAAKKMIKQPKAFFGGLSFRLTAVVYFGTYAAANLSELALDSYKIRDEKQRKKIKVGAASVANIGLLSWRDSIFAREYGGNAAMRSPPIKTVGMFAMRDCATMGATFYVAPKAARYLVQEHHVNRHVAEISTSLGIPVLAQFLTAPIHIHAMDCYVRPAATPGERIQTIKTEYFKISTVRALRIFPAFGIGSYVNNKLRELTIRQPNENLLLSRRVTSMINRQTELIRRVTQGK